MLEKIRKNVNFRIKIFICISLIFNIAYAVFLFVISQIYATRWFFVMSAYYALLSVARVFVLAQSDPKKDERSKIVTMRICGYFLLSINLVISTMMFILTRGNVVMKNHEIAVIALAAYTFFSFSIAVIGSLKYLKKNDHVYSCVKILNLTSASVSLVTLTNTMLAVFGGENVGLLRRIILPSLCGVVAIFIIISAILMVRKANLDLKELKNEENRR